MALVQEWIPEILEDETPATCPRAHHAESWHQGPAHPGVKDRDENSIAYPTVKYIPGQATRMSHISVAQNTI